MEGTTSVPKRLQLDEKKLKSYLNWSLKLHSKGEYMLFCGGWGGGGGVTACQDYFTHFELSQSLGGAKTGGPREKNT